MKLAEGGRLVCFADSDKDTRGIHPTSLVMLRTSGRNATGAG